MVLNRTPPPEKRPLVSFSRPAGFLHLYLDDLEALVRYLGEHTESLTIAAGRAVADEPKDLVSTTPAEREKLTIQTTNPTIRVLLTKVASGASTLEDSDEARALVEGTTAVLRAHRGGASKAFLTTLPVGFIGFILFAIGLVALIIPPQGGTPPLYWASMGGGIVFAIVPIAVSFRSRRRAGQVFLTLRRRDEAQRERASTRALALTAVLGAVVGSAITLAGTVIAQSFVQNPG